MSGRELLLYFDPSTDPVRNLAREEELFELVDGGALPELVRFWVNTECLVRGKARSAKYGWYNEEMAKKMGIPVIMRETGGGVVYHDEGNLNWSLFLRTSGVFLSPTKAFDQGSKYMVRALQKLGVPARFSPPNRIDASDRKVSGMAAKYSVHTLLVHGTLLLNSDLEKLNQLCIPPDGCPPVSNLNSWVKVTPKVVANELKAVLEESDFRVKTVTTLEH